jgi:uncharacterized protein
VKPHLLDANVLIALTVAEHEHHERATVWAEKTERFALCPIVEGALVRFLIRIGEHPRTSLEVLRALHAMERCDFWGDSISYAEVALTLVQGHRQVADAYLAGLAGARGGLLATFDQSLAGALPDQVRLVP